MFAANAIDQSSYVCIIISNEPGWGKAEGTAIL
jgi:hypothetical protein